MKIIQILGMNSTKYGALERFMINLASYSNDDKYLLCYNQKPQSHEFLKDLSVRGIDYCCLNASGRNIILNIPRFIKLILKERPDVIHFHFDSSFAIWTVIARIFGVKKIFKTEHSCIHVNGANVHQKKELSWIYRMLILNGRIYKAITKVLPVSKYVERQMQKLYGNAIRLHQIYIGVNEPKICKSKSDMRFELGIDDNCIVISSVMFSNPIKGCDILLRAISACNIENLRVLVIGMSEESEYTKQMRELAEDLNISTKIIWVGLTDNVANYLVASDFYVQPSRSEALSLAAVESSSCYVPVIGSQVGGLPEIATETFKNGDFKELASKIKELADDTSKRKQLSIDARKKYESCFLLKKSVSEYCNLYHEE